MTADPLAPLRARFLTRAAEDLRTLRRTDADRQTLAYLIHRLAGSAGMFGYHEVTRLAAELDDQMHDGETPDAGDVAALITALEALPTTD